MEEKKNEITPVEEKEKASVGKKPTAKKATAKKATAKKSTSKKQSFSLGNVIDKANEIQAGDNKPLKVLLTAVIIIITIFVIILALGIVGAGAAELQKSFEEQYATTKEEVSSDIYNTYYDAAEKAYHTSNTGTIMLGDLEQSSELEVLKVSDIEYVIDEEADSAAWVEIEGEGSFVVDLKRAEFIVDSDRKTVLVRLPEPKLGNIDMKTPKKVFFATNGWGNGSFKEGTEKARRMLADGRVLIQKELLSNQRILQNAKEAATRIIENLIYVYNSDVNNLQVTIEFYSNNRNE
ncbi:MAG: DUF4230 domain-containing protein [Lachnospiraceae bacterium]|nr:DUF4230 domain-containing protein [Candidatus Merdinaster equi]